MGEDWKAVSGEVPPSVLIPNVVSPRVYLGFLRLGRTSEVTPNEFFVYSTLLANALISAEDVELWYGGPERHIFTGGEADWEEIWKITDEERKIVAYATLGDLKEVTGLSEEPLTKALKGLEKLGWIKIRKGRGRRVFELGELGMQGRWKLYAWEWGKNLEMVRWTARIVGGKFPDYDRTYGRPVVYRWRYEEEIHEKRLGLSS